MSESETKDVPPAKPEHTSGRRINQQNFRPGNPGRGRGRIDPHVYKAQQNFGVNDLRELLDRKHREESTRNVPPADPSYNYLRDPLREDDDFTNQDLGYQENRPARSRSGGRTPRSIRGKYGSRSSERYSGSLWPTFIKNPFNITVELSTSTGERNCKIDQEKKLANIRCVPDHQFTDHLIDRGRSGPPRGRGRIDDNRDVGNDTNNRYGNNRGRGVGTKATRGRGNDFRGRENYFRGREDGFRGRDNDFRGRENDFKGREDTIKVWEGENIHRHGDTGSANDDTSYREADSRHRDYGRGRSGYERGRSDYVRGRNDYGSSRGDYMRGRDTGDYTGGRGDHRRGRGDYMRGRGDYGRGRGDYSRGRGDYVSAGNRGRGTRGKGRRRRQGRQNPNVEYQNSESYSEVVNDSQENWNDNEVDQYLPPTTSVVKDNIHEERNGTSEQGESTQEDSITGEYSESPHGYEEEEEAYEDVEEGHDIPDEENTTVEDGETLIMDENLVITMSDHEEAKKRTVRFDLADQAGHS